VGRHSNLNSLQDIASACGANFKLNRKSVADLNRRTVATGSGGELPFRTKRSKRNTVEVFIGRMTSTADAITICGALLDLLSTTKGQIEKANNASDPAVFEGVLRRCRIWHRKEERVERILM
jgi:hypothetical protein